MALVMDRIERDAQRKRRRQQRGHEPVDVTVTQVWVGRE